MTKVSKVSVEVRPQRVFNRPVEQSLNLHVTSEDGRSTYAYQADAIYLIQPATVQSSVVDLTKVDNWFGRMIKSCHLSDKMSTGDAVRELMSDAPMASHIGTLTGKLSLMEAYKLKVSADDRAAEVYLFERKNPRATTVPEFQMYITQSDKFGNVIGVTYFRLNDFAKSNQDLSIGIASYGALGKISSVLAIIPTDGDTGLSIFPSFLNGDPDMANLSLEDKALALYIGGQGTVAHLIVKGASKSKGVTREFPYSEYARIVHELTYHEVDSHELPAPPEEVIIPEELLGTARDIDAENFATPWHATMTNDDVAEMFGLDVDRWQAALAYANEHGLTVLPTHNIKMMAPSNPEDFEGDEINDMIYTQRNPRMDQPEQGASIQRGIQTRKMQHGEEVKIPLGYVRECDIISLLEAVSDDISDYLRVHRVPTDAARNRLEGVVATLTAISLVGKVALQDPSRFADSIITAAIVADSVRSDRDDRRSYSRNRGE